MIALLFALSARADELSDLWTRLAAPTSVRAEFTQTLHRKLLTRPFETTGRIEFTRPDHVIWTTDAPTPSVFEMRGPDLSMSYPALGVSESLSLRDRPDLQSLTGALTVWLQSDLDTARASYDVSLVDGAAVLVPKDATLARYVARIELVPSADHAYVEQMRLVEPSGDHTEIAFHDVALGPPAP